MSDDRSREPMHPQVKVWDKNFSEMVEVDEDIATLLMEMWTLGITTLYSCQGFPYFVDQTLHAAEQYRAYVLMRKDEASMEFILNIIQNFEPFKKGKISWSIEFDNQPDQGFQRIIIRFPHQDIQTLLSFLHKDVLFPPINPI